MNGIPFRDLIRAIPLLMVAMVVALLVGCAERGADEAPAAADPAAAPSASAILAAHAHKEPGETCFMCDPTKRDKGRLWCREHVRYEDRCWLCHPELEDRDRLYCKEHFLYEDECFLCHPELKAGADGQQTPPDAGEAKTSAPPKDSQRPTLADAGHIFCSEHGVLEIECAICHPDLARTLEPGASLKIRFPSPASAEKAGVRTARPQSSASRPEIGALCEVQYNRNAMARVTPLAGGVIRSVRHDVGDRVKAGDVLVELHSVEAATAKSAYLSALVEGDIRRQSLERAQRLREQNIGAEKDFLQAQAANRIAQLTAANLRQQLVNLGFRADEIQQIEQAQDTTARLVVRAPFDGTIVERDAVAGEAVDIGKPLFTLADLSSRWLMLSISSRHIAQVQRGQEVITAFSELSDLEIRGTITWIDSAIDPQSRMVKARALVTEETERIKTGLFGRARIIIGAPRHAMIVPREAVQRHDEGTFVFVRNEADLFSLRRVALGQSHDRSVEVLAGLSTGDAVVTEGSFVVMSEFLKSRLGAGCADH